MENTLGVKLLGFFDMIEVKLFQTVGRIVRLSARNGTHATSYDSETPLVLNGGRKRSGLRCGVAQSEDGDSNLLSVAPPLCILITTPSHESSPRNFTTSVNFRFQITKS